MFYFFLNLYLGLCKNTDKGCSSLKEGKIYFDVFGTNVKMGKYVYKTNAQYFVDLNKTIPKLNK